MPLDILLPLDKKRLARLIVKPNALGVKKMIAPRASRLANPQNTDSIYLGLLTDENMSSLMASYNAHKSKKMLGAFYLEHSCVPFLMFRDEEKDPKIITFFQQGIALTDTALLTKITTTTPKNLKKYKDRLTLQSVYYNSPIPKECHALTATAILAGLISENLIPSFQHDPKQLITNCLENMTMESLVNLARFLETKIRCGCWFKNKDINLDGCIVKSELETLYEQLLEKARLLHQNQNSIVLPYNYDKITKLFGKDPDFMLYSTITLLTEKKRKTWINDLIKDLNKSLGFNPSHSQKTTLSV